MKYLTTLEGVLRKAAEAVADEPAPALAGLVNPEWSLQRKV